MSLRFLSTSQLVLAGFFVLAGIMHFVAPKPYVAMMPKFLPPASYAPLVWISGVCEILGGIGVTVPWARTWAGIGLLALLVAVFPANVQMLLNARATGASAVAQTVLWLRLPLQVVLLWWVWRATLAR